MNLGHHQRILTRFRFSDGKPRVHLNQKVFFMVGEGKIPHVSQPLIAIIWVGKRPERVEIQVLRGDIPKSRPAGRNGG